MSALKAKGVRIPEDIAFVGFNNDPVSTVIEPNLTTINYSQVTNVSPLAAHAPLTSLDISYIAATNLTPLSGLTNLNTLWSGGNNAGSAAMIGHSTRARARRCRWAEAVWASRA